VRYDWGVTPTRSADERLLDNVAWHALTSVQAGFAQTVGGAARFDPEVSVFSALAANGAASWRDLAELVGADGVAVLFGGEVPAAAPDGWTVRAHGIGHQMLLDRLTAVPLPDSRPLGPTDVEAMTALVELAQPGPFRPRTVELGDYHGVFADGRLVAMAGERQKVPGYTEISAVCTHPSARRRGLGAAMTARVAQGILDCGETPFLQLTHDNHAARRVYEALGFRFRREVRILVAEPPRVGRSSP
jgi:ribosomal protein S18 acetylase RimI-like enzyme